MTLHTFTLFFKQIKKEALINFFRKNNFFFRKYSIFRIGMVSGFGTVLSFRIISICNSSEADQKIEESIIKFNNVSFESTPSTSKYDFINDYNIIKILLKLCKPYNLSQDKSIFVPNETCIYSVRGDYMLILEASTDSNNKRTFDGNNIYGKYGTNNQNQILKLISIINLKKLEYVYYNVIKGEHSEAFTFDNDFSKVIYPSGYYDENTDIYYEQKREHTYIIDEDTDAQIPFYKNMTVYTKHPISAYFSQKTMPINYTGPWVYFSGNGEIWKIEYYEQGKITNTTENKNNLTLKKE